MEEKLVLTVLHFSEVFETNLRSYRDIYRKSQTWKLISIKSHGSIEKYYAPKQGKYP